MEPANDEIKINFGVADLSRRGFVAMHQTTHGEAHTNTHFCFPLMYSAPLTAQCAILQHSIAILLARTKLLAAVPLKIAGSSYVH